MKYTICFHLLFLCFAIFDPQLLGSETISSFPSKLVSLDQQLFKASKDNNLQEVMRLLDQGVDPNKAHDNYNWTALMNAASHGNKEMVQILLDSGALINEITTRIDQNGWNVLMVAVDKGDIPTVETLLQAGAAVNYQGGEKKKTPLLVAAWDERKEISYPLVKLLCDYKADVNAADSTDNTALHHITGRSYKRNESDARADTLIADNFYRIASLLLDRGIKINKQSSYGITALLYATAFGHIDMIKLLLDRGADFNIAHKNGITPLLGAAIKKKWDVVKLLVARGAPINSIIPGNKSALTEAVRDGNLDIVKFLILHGAQVNLESGIGETALMVAVYCDYPRIVHFLLNKGADLYFKRYDGLTIFECINSIEDEEARATMANILRTAHEDAQELKQILGPQWTLGTLQQAGAGVLESGANNPFMRTPYKPFGRGDSSRR